MQAIAQDAFIIAIATSGVLSSRRRKKKNKQRDYKVKRTSMTTSPDEAVFIARLAS